jgi:hypothetical protein
LNQFDLRDIPGGGQTFYGVQILERQQELAETHPGFRSKPSSTSAQASWATFTV